LSFNPSPFFTGGFTVASVNRRRAQLWRPAWKLDDFSTFSPMKKWAMGKAQNCLKHTFPTSVSLLLQLFLAVMPHILNNKTKQGNHTEVDSQALHTMTMKTYEGSDSPHSISSLRLGLPASCVIQPWRQILAE